MSREVESFCFLSRPLRLAGLAVLAVSAGAVFATPAASASSAKAKSRVQVTTEADSPAFRLKPTALASLTMPNLDASRFTFTAPGRISNSKVQPLERGFSFTPSGSSDRKALSVGVTTRTLGTSQATQQGAQARVASAPIDAGLAPSGYGVDLIVGWKGFALNGGVSRLDQGVGAGGKREGADIGLSYASRNWKTNVHASAERSTSVLTTSGPLTERFALEAGGAMALSPGVSVGGSFRYRLAPLNPTPVDPTKDDRAVFLGGAVAF